MDGKKTIMTQTENFLSLNGKCYILKRVWSKSWLKKWRNEEIPHWILIIIILNRRIF